jgi:hypothetical protein
MRLALVAVAALCLAAVSVHAAQDGPDAIAEEFYGRYLTLGPGVPSPPDLSRIAPLLSPSLLDLLKGAQGAESAYAKANTKEAVPPLVEGDLFSSLFEAQTNTRSGFAMSAIRTCFARSC